MIITLGKVFFVFFVFHKMLPFILKNTTKNAQKNKISDNSLNFKINMNYQCHFFGLTPHALITHRISVSMCDHVSDCFYRVGYGFGGLCYWYLDVQLQY